MSEIHYLRKHSLPMAEAKKMVQKAADELGKEYDLTSAWEGDTLHFKRAGIDGFMAVSRAQVELKVKLGFLLRPFKAKFEEHIERNLDRALAGGGKGAKEARPASRKATRGEA